MSASSITLSWDSFWSVFAQQSDKEKINLIKQLGLVRFLNSLSAQYQTEVLKAAPPEVIDAVKPLLYLQTRLNLGLAEPATQRLVSR